jgi:hypothetical protein
MVDGFGVFWIVAHYQYGIPELAVRDSGDDCWTILRMDVEEERIDICVGAGTRGRGCGLAFFVSRRMRGKRS